MSVGAFIGRAAGSLPAVSMAAIGVVVAPMITVPDWQPGPRTNTGAVVMRSDQALIMGGSGMPIPSPAWVDAVFDRYVAPNVGAGYSPQALATPEAFYPLTGVKSLPFDTSAAQGMTIVDTAIRERLAEGDNLVVFGYSQSATIASLEMQSLAVDPPQANQGALLSFVLIGNPSNPAGGLLQRFEGLTLPSLGLTFSGATPPETGYPTDIYTTEYDGWADFPRYPLNVLAVANAFASDQHFAYPDLSTEQIENAVLLPGSSNLTGIGATNYWMVPAENLPLLEPLRAVPLLGVPLAELIEPDLRILVNLGYGNLENGWDPGPANVPTGFGVFPDHISPLDVADALAAGAGHGVQAFLAATAAATAAPALPAATDPLTALTGSAPPEPVGVADAVSAALSAGYAVLLPTADILTALWTVVGIYDADLFADGLHQAAAGDLLGLAHAFADPLAADVALFTLLASFESAVISTAVQSVADSLGVAAG